MIIINVYRRYCGTGKVYTVCTGEMDSCVQTAALDCTETAEKLWTDKEGKLRNVIGLPRVAVSIVDLERCLGHWLEGWMVGWMDG